MKVLVLDNFDSFTYNLVQMMEEIICTEISVAKNNKISLSEINHFDKIVLSPGPGVPSEAGILLEVIREYAPTKSILGVCLGHQAIAEAFGGSIYNLDKIFHGVATDCYKIKEAKILKNIPDKTLVGRYHSWAIDPVTLPKEIEVTAVDDMGSIMSIQHTQYDVHGVQYHPESILTPLGKEILENFLSI